MTTAPHSTPHQTQALSQSQCWQLLSLMLLPVLLLPLPANTPAHHNTTRLLLHVSSYPAPTAHGRDTGHFFAADSAPTATPVLAPSPAPSSISHFTSPPGFWPKEEGRCFESELLLKDAVQDFCHFPAPGGRPAVPRACSMILPDLGCCI